jgi:hypothetical protein
LDTYSEIWPSSGSMRSGVCSALPRSAPRTSGNGSSFWPTASAERYGTNHGGGMGRVGPVRPSLDTLAKFWPTPNLPNGGRTLSPEDLASKGTRADGSKRQVGLENVAKHWPTPTGKDADASGNVFLTTESGRHSGTTLTDAATKLWPTPTAGCKGPGGEGEREGGPTLQTVACWPTPNSRDWKGQDKPGRQNSSLPDLVMRMRGERSLSRGPSSRQPSPETWSTPRANSQVTSAKAMRPFADGGSTSKPSLEQQALGSASTKGPHQLNPAFVEWLMGLTPGHTCVCAHGLIGFERSETESSRYKQPEPSPNSTGDCYDAT